MYNAALHTATNKPIGLTGMATDARTYYYDLNTFSYRPYTDEAEALAYLIGDDRVGHFSIIIVTDEYWFKDGIQDGDLVLKSSGAGTMEESVSITGDGGGLAEIDFTANDRLTKYGTNPTVILHDEGNPIKIFIKDFGSSFDIDNSKLLLDGIFGTKTVVLKK